MEEEDGAQVPLMPAGTETSSTAGDRVRSTHGARFLSWLRRFGRERTAPPSRTSANPSPVSPETLAAAAAGFAQEAARGSALVDEAKTFAEAARAFADAEEPRASRFADDLVTRASALAVAADLLLQQGSSMSTSTGLAVKALNLSMSSQVLVPGFALLAASPVDEQFSGPEEGKPLQSLLRRAREFCADASGTTMDDAAKGFYQAAEEFASGDRKYEKIRDIPLSRAAMNLSRVASRALAEEKKLVLIAQKLESDASVLVLDEKNSTVEQSQVLKVKKRTCIQWFSACISGPSLPLHRHEVKRQEKLAEKRQVIYGICLSTPIALLTIMKAGSVLPPEHTAWVGGISASIWVLVNAGLMMNLYGKTKFELCAAQHLSRLGMLGLATLVCFYMYWWFFPNVEVWLFCTLLGIAALFHCLSWTVGCWRHDDDSTSPADEECMCDRCRPCSCACSRADIESSG